MKNQKVAVYIGRFQILHNGHIETIKNGLKNFDKLIILVGSSEVARDPRNPFTFDERRKVIQAVVDRLMPDYQIDGVEKMCKILPIHDFIYDNNKWLLDVQSQVSSATTSNSITLLGYKKDHTSKYLTFFPQWKFQESKQFESNNKILNATSLRDKFYNNEVLSLDDVPEEMNEYINKFKIFKEKCYQSLVKENSFIKKYKEDMLKTLKYKTMSFLTGDALVVCAGHVLLVKRKMEPGKGLYALPGGFFNGNHDDTLLDCALRELKEETKIKVEYNKLKSFVKDEKIFSDKERSLRWRIITNCAFIQLPYNTLPEVKGSDDAEVALWMEISKIIENRDKFFEDHLSIIDTFLNIC